MFRLAAIGECMIELSADRRDSSKNYQIGYGGDTLNVALYCARWGGEVDYVTAVGDDPFSQKMVSQWKNEKIGVDLVSSIGGRQSGLYLVDTDSEGERSFSYWRENSPAREMFSSDSTSDLLKNLSIFDWFYFSGITLSLFSEKGLDVFWQFLNERKHNGCKVIFDLNYRPACWNSKRYAKEVMDRFIGLSDIALPSQDDEKLLYGINSTHGVIERYKLLGVNEIVVKRGKQGCVLWFNNESVELPTQVVVQPLDTTAAGDSFNGAYLAARLNGVEPLQAIKYGQRCAALVVGYPGAIVEKADWPCHYRLDLPLPI